MLPRKLNIDGQSKEGKVSPMERRTFLKLGLAITGVLAGGKVLEVVPTDASHGVEYPYKPHYSMIIRQDRCIDCERCIEACRITNDWPHGGYRTRILTHEEPRAIGQKKEFIPVLCNQCNNPPCTRACPTAATTKRKDNGIITIDDAKCIGCKTCMLACPYNARFLDGRTKTVDKCDFCWETRLSKGETLTACAEACPADVRIFGDISDPNNRVYKMVYQMKNRVWVLRPESGAVPNVFYTKGTYSEVKK